MNCTNQKECSEMQIFDAIVQFSSTEANIFEMYPDITLGKNRDESLGESPSESTADPDRNLPYVKRVDCANCGEEIELSQEETEKMNQIFKTYKIQLSMYGSVAERADIEVTAQTKELAEKKALKMSENGEVKFSHEDEAPDGWEYQVENAEEVKA